MLSQKWHWSFHFIKWKCSVIVDAGWQYWQMRTEEIQPPGCTESTISIYSFHSFPFSFSAFLSRTLSDECTEMRVELCNSAWHTCRAPRPCRGDTSHSRSLNTAPSLVWFTGNQGRMLTLWRTWLLPVMSPPQVEAPRMTCDLRKWPSSNFSEPAIGSPNSTDVCACVCLGWSEKKGGVSQNGIKYDISLKAIENVIVSNKST